MRRGRYYAGRVVKLGILDQERLMGAIRHSSIISVRDYTWTITDVKEGNIEQQNFIFGKMSKYFQEGLVTIVDSDTKSQVDPLAPNLLQASSPFVYLPKYSGIAYLHVWNGIQEDVFRCRFKAIIEDTHKNFFVDCTIEPITDYRTFLTKVLKIERITEISVKVHPPNPLFGCIWSSLDNYIKKRNADEINIRESKDGYDGIRSSITIIIEAILKNPSYVPTQLPDITDAALLMAADGYGKGAVTGWEGNTEVTVRTSDNQKYFSFPKEPSPDELALNAMKLFESII